MQAELHGKLSPESSQEFERLEDLLTSHVFGVLRYLPPTTALRAFVDLVAPDLKIRTEDYPDATVEFWPTFERTEPDVVIRVGRFMIVVEAKLWSGFGEGSTQADDQLVREHRVASRVATVNHFHAPIVVAVTADYTEPHEIGSANEYIGASGGSRPIRWTNWQALASILESVVIRLEPNEARQIQDVLEVMEKRGVRTMFDGFTEEDYWLLAAAQRRAADAVFPTIATFCDQLRHELPDIGISPATNENRIFTHQSYSFTQPEKWGAGYLYLPLLPDSWRGLDHTNASLFVQFSLREPKVSVGYRHRIRTKDKPAWLGHAESMADAIREHRGYAVAGVKYPDYHIGIDVIDAPAIDPEWLARLVDRAEVRLVFYRELPLSALTSTEAILEMLAEDRETIESMPLLLRELQT